MKRSLVLCLLVATALGSGRATAQEDLANLLDASQQRITVEELQDESLSALLSSLAAEEGIVTYDDSALVMQQGNTVIAMQLDDPRQPESFLYLYYLPREGEYFFLQVRQDPVRGPEMRLWSDGEPEILVSQQGVVLNPARSPHTFRLRSNPLGEKLTAGEAISCIARGLGIEINLSSLTSFLASVACSANGSRELALVACNCLSITGVGTNLLFATLGCVTGIGKMVACGIVSCSPSACVAPIPLGGSVSGSWSSACTSPRRSGRYSKFYTFTLSSTTRVQIDLTSPTDPYLYLLSGSSPSGSVIVSDDDSGDGLNSRIIQTLNAGTYTVEATTYSSGRTGSFTLSVRR